jgi:beta-glucanase (GH16 family)
LPSEKKWQLVWSDEFDGDTLDRSKWGFRLHIMQQRHETFTEDGAVLDGKGNLLLTLQERDGQFYSPHLQTGSNFLDRPGEAYCNLRWPIAQIETPKFMHKYGYYETRCKLPTQPGWWVAFWLQSPIIGSTLNPMSSGVEVDIMENFTRDRIVSHNNHWNGYGNDHQHVGSGDRKLEETTDGFHIFGLDWSQDGYVYYIDGKESWRVDGPVSDCEQFILISTECMGYRDGSSPSPGLADAELHLDAGGDQVVLTRQRQPEIVVLLQLAGTRPGPEIHPAGQSQIPYVVPSIHPGWQVRFFGLHGYSFGWD